MSLTETWNLRKEIGDLLKNEANLLKEQIKTSEKKVNKLEEELYFLSGINIDNASYVVHLKSKDKVIDFAYTGTINNAIINAKKELNEEGLEIKISILLTPAVYPLPKEYLFPLPESFYKNFI